MLLMDSIAKWAAELDGERHPTLALYGDLAARLSPRKGPAPPRYVFDANAIRTATELTLGRPKVFREAMRNMRVPYPAMWVEWEEAGRAKLRDLFAQPPELDAIRPLPNRFGFLIEANDGYRSGKLSWAWTAPDRDKVLGSIPNVSTITGYFDLDGDFPIDFVEKHPISLAEMWSNNPIQRDAFHSIWRTVEWIANERAMAGIARDEWSRALLYADVIGEYIMVWACLMLLVNRQTVDIRTVDMSRLNKARRNKIPLLNHDTVHMHLQPRETAGSGGGRVLDYRRKSPHIHMVSHYLRTDGRIVNPYVRGSGPPVSRTVRVHG